MNGLVTFSTETYRGYEIKSGPQKDVWAANAYRGKLRLAQATGTLRDEAVANVKAQLDGIEAAEFSERDQEGAPSAKAYEQAFRALGKLNDGYRAMLQAHLHALDHVISPTKLAEAAGYANWSAANLHYGRLGKQVAEEINFVPPSRADGSKIWTCAIARDRALGMDFPDTSMVEAFTRKALDGHFEWQMRPQVVEALRSLGY